MRPLAFEDTGAGPPWFLLHGFPLHRGMWDGVRRGLAEEARLLLLDLPGFGASPPGPTGEPATMDAMARAVLDLADRLGVRDFGLAGFSMGGYVALALQAMAPERVGALALLDTQAGADSPEARSKREALAQRVEADGPEVLVREFAPKLLSPAGLADADLVEKVARLVRANPPEGLAAALRGMALRADHRPRLGSVRCPALVLVGEHDTVTPHALAKEMAAALPRGHLARIAGAGHLSPMERPAEVTAALRAFVRGEAAEAGAGARA